ncbi:uncharacterized protein Cwc25 [Epargyreus clarus]|uniref:uncharacterized protein Cwc25 n=1 Tax=Epargyreus clarus TaxID=520877 RepID=UPI003C303147
MGGGDLNAKKAWHPNTLKNQERVWKAEQAAAQEKKRIVELEHERQLERERAELNHIAKSNFGPAGAANDDRLHWMYEKPDKKVQQEEYLLGKAIDKNHEQAGKSEVDEIPAVSRRVVGSSMLSMTGDAQVDLARKIREDPLLLVKERERAARAALLNNPVQRARLTEMLRKEQENKKESKSKKKKKKDKDLDNMLAEKLQALSGKKGIDLATLLASDDSSSESSDEKSKKKKKKKKAKRKKDTSSDSDSDSEDKKQSKAKHSSKKEIKKISKSDKKRRATSESDEECSSKKNKRDHSVKKTSKSNVKANRGDSSDDQQSSDDHDARYDRHSNTDREGCSMIKEDRYWQNNRYTTDYQYSKEDRYSREEQHSKDERYSREERHPKDERYSREERHPKDDRYSREERHPKDERYSRDDRQTRDNRNVREDRSKDDRYTRDDRERNSRDNYKSEKRQTYGPNSFSSNDKERSNKRSGLSEEEKAAKLAEMAAAGAEREKQRERRVAEQLAEKDPADRPLNAQSRSANVVRQLPDSLESRLHSNRHYIQRDKRHMNENFAKR